MVDNVLLFAGSMGAGKTTAIRAMSEIPVVSTEATNHDRQASDKPTTTVALDYGEILLGPASKVRLYGLPGQKRFDFMWRILVERAMGMVLLVDNAGSDPLATMLQYLDDFDELVRDRVVVVGVTRMDLAPQPTIAQYSAHLATHRPDIVVPLMPVDPRDGAQVRMAIMALIASIEQSSRRTLSEEAT